MENWKQIRNYNYVISINGDIKNIKTGRILKQRITNYGYSVVDIQIDKIGKTFKVHRLIAEAFLDNVDNKLEVDHINRIKSDNRIENLRWVTRSENMNNVDWSAVIRNKITKERLIEIAELLKNGKTIDEIYNLVN